MSGRFPPRIFRRVPFEAELQLHTERGGDEIVARTANISLGGTFVIIGEPPPPGTTLELSFKLPEQPAPVQGRGRVAWVREREDEAGRPAGMGVRFLELTPGSREQIFEVVERRVRDGGSPYDTGSEESGSIADRRDDTGPLPAVAADGVGEAPAGAVEEPADGPAPTGPSAAAPAEVPAWEPAASAAEAAARPAAEVPAREPAASAAGPAARPAAPPPAREPVASAPEPAAGPAARSPAREPTATAAETPPPQPLPPVEMPEPEGRFAYPVAGSAYAGRARRGVRGGWLLAAGAVVVVAATAVAGYLLLAGGRTPRVADGARPAAPARPAAGGAAADAGPAGERAAGAEGDPGAGAGAGAAGTGPVDIPAAAEPGDREAGAEAAPSAPPGAAGGGRTATADRRAGSAAPPATRPGPAGAAGAASSEDPAAPAEPLPADLLAASPAGDAAAPARRVTRITWQQRDGATELEIWGDGRFVPGSYQRSSLGGERPRELIRLGGIEEPYGGGSVEVGTPQVSRVRTGHHVETEPDELHVVIDLAGPGVAASELRADGERLWLRLEGR